MIACASGENVWGSHSPLGSWRLWSSTLFEAIAINFVTASVVVTSGAVSETTRPVHVSPALTPIVLHDEASGNARFASMIVVCTAQQC